MNIEERLDHLEERIAALENTPPISNADNSGTVSFTGDVNSGDSHWEYEWARPVEFLTSTDWAPHFERLTALAHPVRGGILKRLLDSPATVTELVEESIVSSSGTGYHHLQALSAAGWVEKSRGSFRITPARIIPLLTIIAATEDHS